MISGEIYYPVELDESGARLRRPDILTGTGADGRLDAGLDCKDWSSTSGGLLLGRATAGTREWTAWGGTSCTAQGEFHLYCFGTDVTVPLSPPPVQGRKAFVTRGTSTSGSGLTAFDKLCAAEAGAAGLPGSFRALVATSTASALSRFDLSGPTWVRPDGVVVAATPTDLLAGRLLAPIDVAADGSYSSAFWAWTGADTPGSVGSATCSDWTDCSSSGQGSLGEPDQTTPVDYEGPIPGSMFTGAVFSCHRAATVYCLQE